MLKNILILVCLTILNTNHVYAEINKMLNLFLK